MKPGTLVKCAYRGDRVGMLLHDADPKAWANSLAFPTDNPDPLEVLHHFNKCKAQGLLNADKHPVLWDFGNEQKVYWDSRLYPANLNVSTKS